MAKLEEQASRAHSVALVEIWVIKPATFYSPSGTPDSLLPGSLDYEQSGVADSMKLRIDVPHSASEGVNTQLPPMGKCSRRRPDSKKLSLMLSLYSSITSTVSM